MSRRRFVQHALTTLAGGRVLAACGKQDTATPAPTQDAAAVGGERPVVKWRLASSFPKSIDTIYNTSRLMAERVFAATDGRFRIEVFAAGELMPGNQVMDAVQQGNI